MNNSNTALTGIQAASKILNITPPEVYFASGSDFPNPEISSIYRHKDNEIIFDEDWIHRRNQLEILVTAFHETRKNIAVTKTDGKDKFVYFFEKTETYSDEYYFHGRYKYLSHTLVQNGNPNHKYDIIFKLLYVDRPIIK